MPGSTPNKGYPFPLVGEAPAGHTQMQDLAMALDADPTGRWQSYTPAMGSGGGNGLTLGDGTLAGMFTLIGETVRGAARVTLGSSSVMRPEDSHVEIGLPFPVAAVSDTTLQLALLFNVEPVASGGTFHAGSGFIYSAWARILAWPKADGSSQAINSGYPFAWKAGCAIQVDFTYRGVV